jgi:Flp pilus assembly protein TadG
MKKERLQSQRGVTLVVVALMLIALMGVVALCIDLGMLYTARTSAQHAADAAALAGAYTFLDPSATQPTAAQNAAIAVAASNKVLGNAVTITSSNVVVNTAATPGKTVTVTVPLSGTSAVNTFFAKALGISSVPVSVTAEAQASNASTGSRCVTAVFIPNTILATTETPATACQNGHILFDSNQKLTSWAQNLLGGCVTIRPTNPQDTGLSAGQFYSLDFGDGGATYRATWTSCLNQIAGANQSLISCNNPFPVKTGDMTGPTKQGVTNLTAIGDQWSSSGSPNFFLNSSGQKIATSDQEILIPVWNDCNPNNGITSGTHGQTVTVIGFMQLFVDGMGNQNACTAGSGGGGNGNGNGNGGGGNGNGNGGSWVEVHTINANGCNNAGSGVTTPSVGPSAVPIQLIKQ